MASNIDLMTVEVRESETNHGIVPPCEVGGPAFMEQMDDMMTLCRGAKPEYRGYNPDVIEVLNKYANGRHLNLQVLPKVGFTSWREAVLFVENDKCIDLALRVHELVTKEWGATPRKDRDFIDGEGGVGFYTRLLDRMKRNLEKAFDVKYYYESKRPLQYLRDVLGMRAAYHMVHYVHPGHWRYVAGHGVKFATVYDYVCDNYELTPDQEDMVFTVCYVASMARSGGGVHLPEDNCAAWSLVKGRDIDTKYKEANNA